MTQHKETTAMITDRARGKAYIAVYDREGRLVALAEAKSRLEATERWASKTFWNLYTHIGSPVVPYFLLALPDRFYLWRDPDRRVTEDSVRYREEVKPDLVVPAREMIRPYLGREDLGVHDISGYAMRLILNAWVADLLNSELSRDAAPEHLVWLFDTGLYEAIRGGRIRAEAPSWSS